jgi:hypothetical protein
MLTTPYISLAERADRLRLLRSIPPGPSTTGEPTRIERPAHAPKQWALRCSGSVLRSLSNFQGKGKTMTRKDFEAVAKALGSSLSLQSLKVTQIQTIVERFADGIAHTNPNFKRSVFVKYTLDNTFSEG